MDKANIPKRRNKKPLNLFRSKISETKERSAPKQKKLYRTEKLGWLKTIFKALAGVWDWFGGYFGRRGGRSIGIRKPRAKVDPQHPRWFEKRIARNRRRRKLGNISRRANR